MEKGRRREEVLAWTYICLEINDAAAQTQTRLITTHIRNRSNMWDSNLDSGVSQV